MTVALNMNGVVEVLMATFDLVDKRATPMRARLTRMVALGWPIGASGKGRQATYDLGAVLGGGVAFALMDAGMAMDRAVDVCRSIDLPSGSLARRVGAARGRRGELLIVDPRELGYVRKTDRSRFKVGFVEARNQAAFGATVQMVLDLGSLGERLTKILVEKASIPPVTLEVAFSQL